MFWVVSGCLLIVLCYLLFLSMGYVASLSDHVIERSGQAPLPVSAKPQEKPTMELSKVVDVGATMTTADHDDSTQTRLLEQRESAC
jgi:hypothetical protein